MRSGTAGSSRVTKLRFLLDTNVFIAVEPYAGVMERGLQPGAELLRLAAEQGHVLLLHPATYDDIREDKDALRRAQRLAEAGKYRQLTEVPVTARLEALAGSSPSGSNDHKDLRLLAALDARAATYLISEDIPLRKRATRAELGDAVLTVAEAVTLLRNLASGASPPPPQVQRIPSYALNPADPIFGSLRADYPGFDAWLDRVRSDEDGRLCFVIRDDDGYAALALLKRESHAEYTELRSPVLKLSTFKVDAAHSGSRYGELLLKAIFATAHDEGAGSLYVTVLPRYELLIQLLDSFGFAITGHRTALGELVLVKQRRPGSEASSTDLDYHVRYGPPALALRQPVYVVPIEPRWHEQLFPDAPVITDSGQDIIPGMETIPRTHPWGNALRKAYICHSNNTRLEVGDTLLFYRSHDVQAITAVGVVDGLLRSSDPDEIITYVGGRTVYAPAQIVDMCQRVRKPLVIRFRQDRFVDPPWKLRELCGQHVLADAPQTIVTVRAGGVAWLRTQLTESP